MIHSDQLRRTFDVFSERQLPTDTLENIPSSFRNRLVLLYEKHLRHPQLAERFSQGVIQELRMLKADLKFGSSHSGQHTAWGTLAKYILECPTKDLIDVIEIAFKITESFTHVTSIRNSDNEFVEAINLLFRRDQLPYRLTPATDRYGRDFRLGLDIDNIAEFPKAIVSEDELTHNEAVLPALHALSDPCFSSANAEFREAHKDYLEGSYGDCIRNCCNSLESTIKALHKANNWSLNETATLNKLVESLHNHADLPTWFKQSMTTVGTARNTASTAHGGGNKGKNPERAMTRFILTTTAAIIAWIAELK